MLLLNLFVHWIQTKVMAVGISIHMLKLRGTSFLKPLHILFNNSVINECFPNRWIKQLLSQFIKKVTNKEKKITVQCYSFLFVAKFSKKYPSTLFKYLEDNKLLNGNQSGFRFSNSYLHQLLSVTHEIDKSFEANPSLELRGFFLNISKAFDWVWYDGLLYKLKLLGIYGRYYNLILSVLDNRHQRVVVNGQSSKWSLVEAGIPQGSILGPLLFLVNNLPQGLRCNAKLVADDTSFFSSITSPAVAS